MTADASASAPPAALKKINLALQGGGAHGALTLILRRSLFVMSEGARRRHSR
jgi:predicted acylesterase/phospholipase RssA